MGTFVPVLGALTKTVGALSTIGTAFNTISGGDERLRRAQQDQAMRNLQARQAQGDAQASAQASQQRATIALDAQEADDRRRAALKRAVAKRNAQFGATGIGGAGGSREAVLLGLFDESESEKQNRENLDKIRYGAIDNTLGFNASRNVLEQTELKNRQRLDDIANRY
jgi:hypothetical protein